jgi:hypothetical protein
MHRVILALLLIAGCLAREPATTMHRATAVERPERIAGTLYVVRPNGWDWDLLTIRDGVVVATDHNRPPPLAARNKPRTSLPQLDLFGGNHVKGDQFYTDATACEPLAISPGGLNAACLRSDGRGTLTVFRVANPAKTQRNAAVTVGEYSRHMMGFLSDDRLAVVADDEACPFFRRADGRYANEPRGRVRIVDMTGRLVGAGPCVHGLAAGDGKLAYLQHDAMEHPLYSLDGRTWSNGSPATFDGSGSLLVIDDDRDLVDTRGRLVAHHVSDAFWTR